MQPTAAPTSHTARPVWPWLAAPAAALLALVFWVASPSFDLRLPTDPANPAGNPFHFWTIGAAGALSLVVGVLMGEAGRRRSDARVLLLALAMLNAAAAILLHALATPNVLQPGRNVGFVTAAPVGLVIASGLVAVSALELSPARARAIVAWQGVLGATVAAFWLLFGLVALLKLPPFSLAPAPEVVDTPLFFCLVGQTPAPLVQWPGTLGLAAATLLYGFAAARYLAAFRRTAGLIPLALAGACVALAVVALNVGFARTWHLSWWQWHLMVLLAFGLLAFAVYRQYSSEGSARPVFDSLLLDETVRRVRQEYSGALESLVEAIQRREAGAAAGPPVSRAVAERFGLSEGQAAVLERAAEALAHEREQIERLRALVAIGQESSVIQEEGRLLRGALGLTSAAFRDDALQIGLLQEGRLDLAPELRAGPALPPADPAARAALLGAALRERGPTEAGATLAMPLTVKGRPAGVLEVRRAHGGFAERDRWMLRSLAAQLSMSLENARLYRQIDQLFRQYLPASVATALLADPAQAALGGATREISVMFADLRGFTSLAERLGPPELVALLNRYYGAASQAVLAEGGTIDKFMGDALMALFNAPAQQPDHALRACRAALAMQRAIAPIAAEAPDMPRFGIGVNTGAALVGNIGSEAVRNFTAIGDSVNLASRLQSRAEGGHVLIGASTYAQVRDHVEAAPLGRLQVKGKAEAVEVYLLTAVR
ncbi:MAG TPA: adenylate/guanylate cyclase domain-containing protein [Chloroflexaceae bacterium]|nr:adenylate/guanylate cyclase domain-containing protein [Chloroflexaceae bacterium]